MSVSSVAHMVAGQRPALRRLDLHADLAAGGTVGRLRRDRDRPVAYVCRQGKDADEITGWRWSA